jgi:hypothetical protein
VSGQPVIRPPATSMVSPVSHDAAGEVGVQHLPPALFGEFLGGDREALPAGEGGQHADRTEP